MRLDITPHDARILIDALSMPQGVPKVNRPQAEQLRKKLCFQVNAPSAPKSNGGRIRSSWPTGDVQNKAKPHWSFDQPAKVKLPKATTPTQRTTVEDVLKGLI